ncbi:uncharacterized protein At5g50100, chloroplastic isoform X2 [Prosopis cineraria]|uniref:uncharacterized protein At5g50100, chloroplastic isoform X2 n=1 Tax=Prosopis cineraria TaxID=364024 RepID=UPI00240FA456|nr:uncharacterized protein At5g50100, chloroplastic isoform X2 [Prosopis cineraria]
MALRGAAAASMASASSSFIARRRTPIFLSIPRYFKLKAHNPPTYHANSLLAIPIYRPGFQCQIRAISQAAAEIEVSKRESEEQSPEDWKIKMLYDGDCPLCMREVNMLRERNKTYRTIKFVDISSDDYSPQENQGLDYETAFRRLYEQVGLGWVYAVTKYEPIATVADAIYGVWAKYRLQITGRPPMEEILRTRRKKGEACKDSNACKM